MNQTVDSVQRPLGARGSRRAVAPDGSTADLSPTAAAVLAAIPTWWKARAEQAGLDGVWLDVSQAVDAVPPFDAEALPALEEEWGPLSGEDVGTSYFEALSPATRSRHGRHYTPAPLAEQLWSQARRVKSGEGGTPQRLTGLVRDPACGGGALLLPVLREHLRASSDIDPRLVLAGLPSLVEGIDNDPAAVWVASLVLAAEMLPLLERIPEGHRRPLPALCRVGDGLAPQETSARIVVMNPPYGRVRLSDEERARFAPVLYGHANLYGIFMAAAEESLADDGVLAALVPTSFLAGRYFAPLRERFSSALTLSEVAFVAQRTGVFSSVLQETCLATFTRGTDRQQTEATISSIHGGHRTDVARTPTPHGPSPWILPRRAELAGVAAAVAVMPLTLAEAGWRVSTGPLVWNRRVDDLGAVAGTPVIWSADFDGGVLHTDARRSPMRFLRLQSERDRRTMTLREPAILVQRTSAPEQVRRVTSVQLTTEDLERLGGAVVVENHVNVLRPRAAGALLSMTLLSRLLDSPAMDAVARCVSGSVALSAFELSALPLPEESVLAAWEQMDGVALDAAIAEAYGLAAQGTATA
ncbi:MAG: Eco57I restriction-modification methylase domain-containing protein [Brachybacterium sp.]|jgi:adenine-specific DNA-methyltransferase|uniref:Eco57I restriction-modification methylase domain-containing protein n=1 Tax=Brachybacterium sp. TaxID=1891286 RepID=UPI0032422CC5